MAGLYVHIPFCHSKCAYCDFYSTPNQSYIEDYINAVCKEWKMRRHELNEPLETLYIGGGTPSILPQRLLDNLLKHINKTDFLEVTIEANPEDITQKWIDQIKGLGINRVSMGIQSFDDNQLKFIGRRHSARQAIDASHLIIKNGLRFNLDLIYGLPLQDINGWKKNLDIAFAISPEHFSAYLLSYEQGTRLWAMKEAGKIEEASEETATDMYHYLFNAARSHGYRHYEISNFAKKGSEAIHNTNYWLGKPYIGLGASAHSFYGAQRGANPSSIKCYIESINNNLIPLLIEQEDEIDRINDVIITQLRLDQGLSLDEFSTDISKKIYDAAKPMLQNGSLIYKNNHIIIPEKEMLRSDAIMRELIIEH